MNEEGERSPIAEDTHQEIAKTFPSRFYLASRKLNCSLGFNTCSSLESSEIFKYGLILHI